LLEKVTFNDLVFEYLTFGEGDKYLIAFHGFGMHASDYKVFEDTLGKEFKIISINHFFHGNSLFPHKRLSRKPFKRSELKNLIDLIIEKHQIDKFSIAGFSLGGRLALTTFELFPSKTDRLFLFAPDGIKTNLFYQIVSRTIVGQKLYSFLINNPNLFLGLVSFFKKTKFFSRRFYNFIIYHIDTEEKRRLLYNIWMCYRLIHPSKKKYIDLSKKHNVKTNLFLGKHDEIITPTVGKELSKKLKGLIKLHIIYSSHNILSLKTNKYIAKHIYQIQNYEEESSNSE
jgi:pimeloyl-ACP methyl ester carboxylesterase